MEITYNFKPEEYNYKYDIQNNGEFTDYRNGIICRNPSADLECYINYIDYLNLRRADWQNYGYLDLGMMPFVMGPSFLHRSILQKLLPVLTDKGITGHSMPPVSLMYGTCKMSDYDIWVFREDAAKVLGKDADKVTAVDLIKECWL